MEHFRILLTQQKEALEKDLKVFADEILFIENQLNEKREKRDKGSSLLRSINKKLEKL